MKRWVWVKWVVAAVLVALVTAAAFCWVEAEEPLPVEPPTDLPASTSWRQIEGCEGREVTALMTSSTACKDGKINYKTLLKEDVYFPAKEAFLPWDEVMYLVKEVGLAAIPALGKLQVTQGLFLVQNDTFYLRVAGNIPVGNKLLRFLLGGRDYLDVGVYLKITVTDSGELWVEDMQLSSSAVSSDATWRLACRHLTGEGDYLALARKYLGATAHLGKVGAGDVAGPSGMSDEGLNLILNQL